MYVNKWKAYAFVKGKFLSFSHVCSETNSDLYIAKK